MDMIAHCFRAADMGILFTVRSSAKLKDSLVVKAIQGHWKRMTERERKRAVREKSLRIDLSEQATERLLKGR